MKFFELFKNKNLSSNICFSQILSLAFKNCAASIEKCHFFQIYKIRLPSRQTYSKFAKFGGFRTEKKYFYAIFDRGTIVACFRILGLWPNHGNFYNGA
jgi:hypothetical protein